LPNLADHRARVHFIQRRTTALSSAMAHERTNKTGRDDWTKPDSSRLRCGQRVTSPLKRMMT
jgi:hypothetical protein